MQKGSALSRAVEHLSGGESGVGEDIVVWVPFGTGAHLQEDASAAEIETERGAH